MPVNLTMLTECVKTVTTQKGEQRKLLIANIMREPFMQKVSAKIATFPFITNVKEAQKKRVMDKKLKTSLMHKHNDHPFYPQL